MFIGYNIDKINEMMQQVADTYKNVVKAVDANFQYWFRPSLLQHWVGPDEQDFERKFIDRLNQLFIASEDLSKNAIETIYNLAIAWIQFQHKNKIEGGAIGGLAGPISSVTEMIGQLEKPAVSPAEPIPFEAKQFSKGENLGLASENSAAQLSAQLGAFVNKTKSMIQSLYDVVNANNAFYGEQLGLVQKYLSQVSISLGDISTAVKDFDEAMASLISSYATADADIVAQFTSSTEEMANNINNEISSTRWQ